MQLSGTFLVDATGPQKIDICASLAEVIDSCSGV